MRCTLYNFIQVRLEKKASLSSNAKDALYALGQQNASEQAIYSCRIVFKITKRQLYGKRTMTCGHEA